jgi:dTDP-4-amino-4,6-dideoxy-D-galactose acyltransferase
MIINTQILTFDTNLAGFKVAKILPSRLSEAELRDTLTELKQQDVCLVYWLADSDDAESNQAAITARGFLASQHVTYLIKLTSLDLDKLNAVAAGFSLRLLEEAQAKACDYHSSEEQYPVEFYQDQKVSAELEQLAFAAGGYSHFKMDPKFPRELFFKIYHEWIKNSVNKSIANDIIIIKDQDRVVAMTTLGTKNNRGDIGLLAVDANFRGKNFGTKIVTAAQLYFITQGFELAQVVTQVVNTSARRLYEKCGFKPEKFENFYHFWL